MLHIYSVYHDVVVVDFYYFFIIILFNQSVVLPCFLWCLTRKLWQTHMLLLTRAGQS